MTPSLPFPISDPPQQHAPTGLESVSSLLKSAGITRRRLKKLDAIVQVHEQGRDHKAEKAYSARPFVLRGIPVRRPAKSSLEYSRQNGCFRLRVIGHPDYGLPFGQDRLLLIWIATMATWQKTREIRFRSAAAILQTFDLPKDGRYYKRLIAGFERIFYATFFFSSDQQVGEVTIMERQSFRFIKDAKLWYSDSGRSGSQVPFQERAENAIILSEEFWKEIQEHPIPVDLALVKALAERFVRKRREWVRRMLTTLPRSRGVSHVRLPRPQHRTDMKQHRLRLQPFGLQALHLFSPILS